MKKSISIIIPIYNVEKYLKQCLDSIYKLSLENKEIILVNDGSTDNSLKIAEEYYKKYKEHTKLITQKNGGLSDARNTGIKNSIGEYLFFLDSDDFVNSESLERFFREGIEKKQEILIGNYFHYYSDESNKKRVDLVKYSEKLVGIYNKNGDFFIEKGMEEKSFVVNVWKNLYQKEFLIKKELHFEKGLLHEDLLFTLQSFRLAKKVGCSKEKFYYYRQDNSGSIMRTLKEKNYVHMIYIIDKLIDFQEEIKRENKYFNRILLGIYWQIVKNGKLKNEKLFQRLLKLEYNFLEKLKIVLIIFVSFFVKKEIKETPKL